MATKLWDKGFEPDKMIEEYTVGDDRELDMRLAKYDVEGSLAHIAMLEKIGLLTSAELEELTAGLKEIAAEIGNDGSGALKKYVTESVNAYLAPIREKRRALENDLDMIKDILHEGNKKANLIADATLNEVREAMNMLY